MIGQLLNYVTLCQRLTQLGFLANQPGTPQPTAAQEALAAYQKHHNLPSCGKFDGATERHLCSPRCCRFPDRMNLAADLQKWPAGMVITWKVETAAGILPRTAIETAYMSATQDWMKVCGVKFEPTANSKTAGILVHFSGIDGAGRVLAWSDLPDDKGSQRIQRFDSEEPWVVSDKPKPGEIDFVRVVKHELGHVLGIGHIGMGNLLQPMYDPALRSLQAGDIAEAVARYGPPTIAPSGSGDGARRKVMIEVEGDLQSVTVGGVAMQLGPIFGPPKIS